MKGASKLKRISYLHKMNVKASLNTLFTARKRFYEKFN